MKNILVTGGNGYLATHLINQLLLSNKYKIRASIRSTSPNLSSNVIWHSNKSLDINTDWSDALKNVDLVVHTAARVHIIQEQKETNSLEEFRRVNVLGTERLIEQAAKAKITRFIFISSIGVNGGETQESAFTENDIPNPHSFYAQSKLEAEEVVKQLCSINAIDYIILRPPLIYSFNAPGNFYRLLKIIAKGFPLLFGYVNNKRSIIAIENLVEIIIRILEFPQKVNDTFLVADSQPISTHQMMLLIAKGMQRHNLSFPISPKFLYIVAKILKKESTYHQLCSSLHIDTTKIRHFFDWVPSLQTMDGLYRAGKEFHNETHN